MSQDSQPFTIGAPQYQFVARPLSEQEYLAISRRLMQRVRQELKASWPRQIVWLGIALIIGGLIGFVLAFYRVSASLDIFAGRNDGFYTAIAGWGLLIVFIAIFIAGIAVQVFATVRYQKKFYAQALKRSQTFALTQRITLADNGIEAACATGTSTLAWPRATHRLRHQDLQVIVFDQAMLIWLPQSAIDATAGAAAFLDEKTGIALQ